jgi:death-on-curing protein
LTSSRAECWEYLELEDVFVIAERVLGVSADDLMRVSRMELALSALDAPRASFEGIEFHPRFSDKVAVLCYRFVRNHPLPDGNKRVGYLSAVEFAERNGFAWGHPAGDLPGGDETVEVIEAVAAGRMDEHDLERWIRERLQAW